MVSGPAPDEARGDGSAARHQRASPASTSAGVADQTKREVPVASGCTVRARRRRNTASVASTASATARVMVQNRTSEVAGEDRSIRGAVLGEEMGFVEREGE